ncbi:MAG TPA: hypothetical protein ENN17_01465, partial [bacterium]|nr:hypothetical protein [bacterium]
MKAHRLRGMIRHALNIWGIWVVLFALILGVAGILHPGIGNNAALIFLGIAAILLLLLGIFTQQIRPAKALIDAARNLSQKDIVDLKAGVADLSQGNLSTRLAVQTEPLRVSAQEEWGDLVHGMNRMIEQLQETAEEFNNLTETPCLRLCYVGADSFLEGQKCGDVLGEAVGGRGQIAISSGSFQHSGLELRRKGFESVLRQKYPDME